jgi:hypothetical protein
MKSEPPPYAPGIAHRLSRKQREMLIRHVAGSQPFIIGTETPTVQSLMGLRLLKGDRQINHRNTALTYLGREVVCVVLGEYADALLLAGLDYEQRLLPTKQTEVIRTCQSPSKQPAELVPMGIHPLTKTSESDSASERRRRS